MSGAWHLDGQRCLTPAAIVARCLTPAAIAGVLHYQLACVEALAGNTERAFSELEVALNSAERFRAFAVKDDDFASIRDDPRFAALTAAG